MSLLERLLGETTPEEQIDLESRQETAEDALRERVDPETGPVEDSAVTGVAVVNEGPDEEPIVVPIARFSLGESVEDPDMDVVWRLVPEALRALDEGFGDEGVFVRHYDVQFTFDGDGLLEAEECRRVAVPPAFVERLVSEPGFDGPALRDLVEREDDLDDEVAPVAWGNCEDYVDRNGAAVVTAGSTAAMGASASAATCAGASTGGFGGGTC
jgi:hypothetical protein